ncbi:glycine--tRNA ligase subunit alpha [Buchnera aphidicola]|uniref:glycine--tRNA ligase subunit alpha n=1 Tax=Buchnera aphidicola TaxID=9 RepID=UPI0031B88776
MKKKKKITCCEIISKLKNFWSKNGCIILQPIDIEVGAGTFHQYTFFKSIGPKPLRVAYIQNSRRPTDGRYSNNPNRLQQYYQLQVIIKPAPNNIQQLYLKSLQEINISTKKNDIRFIEDNWENTTLGAWGIGWEIWINGMEVTQFTYFQKMGSIICNPITVEITYGIERIAMNIQNINNVYDILWDENKYFKIYYKELFKNNEIEQSMYNFQQSNIKSLIILFNEHIKEAKRLISLKKPLIIPSYEHILHAIHNFNVIDAKQVISNTERQKYIFQIRSLSAEIAQNYYKYYVTEGFPLIKREIP